MKFNRIENLVFIIFLCVGLIFTASGSIFCVSIMNYDNKTETTGVITEIGTYSHGNKSEHSVYVAYNVNGTEYNSRLNSYSSTFYEGKEITIYYDNAKPEKIGVKSLDKLFFIFPAFGITFTLFGGGALAIRLIKNKSREHLIANGRIIYAEYIKTVKNTAYSVNRVHPYNIICEWTDPENRKKYTFKSKNIWTNPQREIHERDITRFPVYLGNKSNTKYTMDISAIQDSE